MENFDYPYTCPIIDRGIDNIKDQIDKNIKWLVRELCPKFFTSNEAEEYCEEMSTQIFKDIESDIENIRQTNEDMREAADEQIEHLQEQILKLTKGKK